ncbi:MAG: trypsin-like peptidase domain-containing protein [bacterium]|nr:trypsin-like peptidase domain-containing protein [bacterium]
MISEEKQTIEVVKKVTPSVVNIVVSKALPKVKEMAFGQMLSPGLLPHGEEMPLPQDPNEKVKVGGGSGFIVDPSGIILTNKHVVIDPDADYVVTTFDEQEHPAKVLTRDPINDVAILKIEAQDLPVVKFASNAVEPGQTVIAIGNALGLFSNTVSKGIISGLSRKISAAMGGGGPDGAAPTTEELRGVIQTDVAINQGNSGGPLINMAGEVVGINTAVIFGAQNIGFAIPIEWAKNDLQDLIKFGRIVRPYIGLRYVMLNKEIKKRYALPVDYGALVLKDAHFPGNHAVVKDSPADKAGIKENDIITELNGEKLDEKNDLSDKIQLLNAGDEIELTFLRKSKAHKAKTVLQERKS